MFTLSAAVELVSMRGALRIAATRQSRSCLLRPSLMIFSSREARAARAGRFVQPCGNVTVKQAPRPAGVGAGRGPAIDLAHQMSPKLHAAAAGCVAAWRGTPPAHPRLRPEGGSRSGL